MDFTATGGIAVEARKETDWPMVKAAILAKLDIETEYTSLGIRFTGPKGGNSKKVRECHAIDRTDDAPSAFVNVRSGIYHDSGGEGVTLNFWDFALKHGRFGRWIDVMKAYATRTGVDLGTTRSSKEGRIREATYLYREADGTVRYAVFRYRLPNGKKKFSQHPPDGRGGWVYGEGCMDRVEPLPYRLPELLDPANADEPVWIVEGEKDCELLAGFNLVATTNHMGANSTDTTWPKFVEYFRGRDCYILPDNDTGGWRHTNAVAGYLSGVARTVKVVGLPGLGPRRKNHGLDVSDWLDLGHGIDELGHVAHAAPVWSPEAGDEPRSEAAEESDDDSGLPPTEDVVTVRLSDVVAVAVEWLMPGRIPLGKLTLLAGLAKQGKSFLTIELAARVSTGAMVPCGDGECFPLGDVILLSAEDDLDDTVKPRLIAAEADTTRIHALTTVRMPDGTLGPFNLSYIPHLERAILRQPDVKLVIIDPVTHYVGGKVDDHKVAQLRALLGPLKDLAARRHIAILIVTHFNKGSGTNALHRVIGSSAYTALARANWIVMRDPKDPKRRLMLDAGTNLAEDPPGLAFRIVDSRIRWEEAAVEMNANDALDLANEDEKSKKREGGGKIESARDWLANLFSDGREVPSEEVLTQGKDKGFSRDILFQAKKDLGIGARKSREHNGVWIWYRKDSPDTSDSSTVRRFDSSNGRNGNNGEDYGEPPPF